MIAQQTKYRPTGELFEELFGRKMSKQTYNNWRLGKHLPRGIHRPLKVVRVGRDFLTTEEWLIEFLTIEGDVGQPESAKKQAKSKAKADAVAEQVCEAFNI